MISLRQKSLSLIKVLLSPTVIVYILLLTKNKKQRREVYERQGNKVQGLQKTAERTSRVY